MIESKLPSRKHPRLKNYDYSQNGYYFVTICCHNDLNFFGGVGRGLAPATKVINLSARGKIAEEQLLLLEKRSTSIKIDKYIIMPNHIHAIIVIDSNEMAGASPRPTLSDIICAFKSLTTRECNKLDNVKGRKIFQTSFYDSVLTNPKAYENAWLYIDGNANK